MIVIVYVPVGSARDEVVNLLLKWKDAQGNNVTIHPPSDSIGAGDTGGMAEPLIRLLKKAR